MNYFPGATSEPNASFPPEFTAKGVPFGGSAVHYCDQAAPLDSPSPDINLGESTVGGTTANTVEPGTTVDHEFQALLIKVFSLLAGGHVGNGSTHPTSASSVDSTSFRLPLSQSLRAHSPTTPAIQSGNQLYQCSWYLPGSNTQCDHVAPNRLALLRHLGKKHQVAGGAGAPIICCLVDSTTGSVCGAPVKRGNFPRHLDTHYFVPFHCPHCPASTSFSRKDTWSKHVRDKHT